jgi:hypothetical protein
MTHNQPISFAGGMLGLHRHVCAFFESKDEEDRTLLPFITDGFAQGDRTYHIVDPEAREEHLRRLTQAGIEVVETQASGQLVVAGWHETYLREGRFDLHKMLALIEEILRSNDGALYPITRLIAHMGWALQDRPGVGDLVEYESRVNYVTTGYRDVVICTYDLAEFQGHIVTDIMRTHPMVIIGGVLQQNPFYIQPDDFLREMRPRA